MSLPASGLPLSGFLGAALLPVKAVHIIFVIYWMAGLFIAGRYLVHLREEMVTDKKALARWRPRFRLLHRMILTPSLSVSWVLGLTLATNLGFTGGWLHVKIGIVLLLSLFQFYLLHLARQQLGGETPLGPRALRLLNEVPSFAIIAIVLLVVLRPF